MPRKAQRPAQIYQIKVTLQESRPPIWRRIQVREDITLAKLHSVLQAVMGWTDSHLHQFVIGKTYYGVPDEDESEFRQPLDEQEFTLSDLGLGQDSQLQYDYDFGDNWHHMLRIEKILPPQPGLRTPVCLAGARACPPEDVGGVWGYETFLKAIGDPGHPQHTEMAEWTGGEFDPEAFDLDAVNADLRGRK